MVLRRTKFGPRQSSGKCLIKDDAFARSEGLEKMETCVVFATSNRPKILSSTLRSLEFQTVQPASTILSCVTASDADLSTVGRGVKLITGERGLTKQRNAALRSLPENVSIVVFFDDDFIPHPRWIEVVEHTFRTNPDIMVVTGNVIADGINGPGYTFEQAQILIENFKPTNINWIVEPRLPYGCNMAFRRSAIKDVWFDERLVLYGWQEDRDFGARVAKQGRAVQVGAASGVHLGVKTGRGSGVRLGYSQITNPIYLHRKGTMAFTAVVDHIFRNFISNLVRALVPESYVDRPGRLRGNLLAFADVLRGRILPERAEQL
jgi:GT2 family glycosyltransferase